MNNRKWIFTKEIITEDFSRKFNKDKSIISILVNRGIDTEKKLSSFFSPSLSSLSDSFLLQDMDKAVERILNAMQNKERIFIYGDYDVDGITSTSLCILALKKIGINADYYIPIREEGYGLNKNALQEIKDKGGSLVITVDCGISSIDEVDFANSISLDMIITDHHEINNNLPAALAVINPKRNDNIYQFKYLAGVGTAFMLLKGLYEKLNIVEQVNEFIDIVAIGTVADLVPIIDENRILVKNGLEKLLNTKNIGLKALFSKLFDMPNKKKFSTFDIGFVIGPAFNAAGRLTDAKKGVELLISDSEKESLLLADYLKNQNSERQLIEKNILEKVEKQINEKKLYEKGVIVAYDKEFHHGVIGIVASRITEKYYKPSIILEIKEEEGFAVGSARSIESFNIIRAIDSMSDLFLKYGGHEAAAGFSLKIENIPIFEERINNYADSTLTESDYIKPVKIDKEIDFFKISYDFCRQIEELSPFGFGNPNPMFAINSVEIFNIRKIGKDFTHLMFDAVKNNFSLKSCVWFGAADKFEMLSSTKKFDIAFKTDISEYKDKLYSKVYIEDVKFSDNVYENKIKSHINLYDTVFPIKSVVYSRTLPVKNKELFLNFDTGSSSILISQENKTLGFLNEDAAYILNKIKENYNLNFYAIVTNIVEKTENFNIFIDIKKDFSFNCYSIKEGNIFKDIKEFLIKDFEYNNFQKKILSSLFKSKKNTFAIYEDGRGTTTAILSAAIYFFIIKKEKSALITDKDITDEFILTYFDIFSSEEYLNKAYPFYVYLDKIPSIYKNLSLVLNKKDLNLKGFETISDAFKLPENIKIIPEKELELINDEKTAVYTKKLPFLEKKEIFKNLENYKIIYATNDIKALI